MPLSCMHLIQFRYLINDTPPFNSGACVSRGVAAVSTSAQTGILPTRLLLWRRRQNDLHGPPLMSFVGRFHLNRFPRLPLRLRQSHNQESGFIPLKGRPGCLNLAHFGRM